MSEDTTTTPTKPGYKTPAFYLAILATVGSALAASGAGLGQAATVVSISVTGLAAVGYTAVRAFAKSEDPLKPSWKTTEFWLSCTAALMSFVYASGFVTTGSMLDKAVAVAVGLLSMAGYQVAKPKA